MALRMIRSWWLWLALALGLNVADAVTTLVAMTRYGVPELSAAPRMLMAWLGLVPAVIIVKALTMVVVTIGATLVYSLSPKNTRWYLAAVCALIALPVVNNLWLLALDARLLSA